jgi:hypothetical protein
MLSLTVFSQTGTVDSIPTKSFPIPVVKLIIKDLISGDSAKAQLKITEEQLKHTEKLVSLKDSIIVKQEEKFSIYDKILLEKDGKIKVIDDKLQEVNRELKKEKFKNKLTKIIGTSLTAILAVLIIIK